MTKLNFWKTLAYRDPFPLLQGLRHIQATLPLHELPYEVSSLRTRELKPYGEERHIAMFTYLISHVVGEQVRYAPVEMSDYDFVTARERHGEVVFTPVQMKELVPEELNSAASLQGLIDKAAAKYTDSDDLALAIALNRRVHIEIDQLRMPRMNIGAIWLFGASTEDQSEWLILGDISKPGFKAIRVRHPEPGDTNPFCEGSMGEPALTSASGREPI